MLSERMTWEWLHERVEVTSKGCWEWTRAKRSGGYGNVFVTRGLHTGAHRVAYEMANGEIEGGLLVLHRCDNPPCCNPEHLYLGDKKQNARDAFDRGLQTATRLYGARNAASKLTQKQVEKARRMWRPGVRGHGAKVLAKRFQVAPNTMLAALKGDTWKKD